MRLSAAGVQSGDERWEKGLTDGTDTDSQRGGEGRKSPRRERLEVTSEADRRAFTLGR